MSSDPLLVSTLNKEMSWFYIIAFIHSAFCSFPSYMSHAAAHSKVPPQIMNQMYYKSEKDIFVFECSWWITMAVKNKK